MGLDQRLSSAAPMTTRLQREAQAQLALTELFPHLRSASDDALRDIFVSLRATARPAAATPSAVAA